MTKFRQFTIKDGIPPVHPPEPRTRSGDSREGPEVFGAGGVVFREGGDEQEQAVREWLKHLDAGRLG